eukprot:CAMPEP_0181474560 /NCGR_PEP_ID=MMETSP1110-20121109/40723_1 /TAXON_ID=174948 /ORGANISM="Symbiodinium sp., Strain CCMP421" /LENGTH=225 /DNA_ID=CAMNT_0023599753 /DNA_START=58 /DNA_END=732 /DNA_ORIENTATION=-
MERGSAQPIAERTEGPGSCSLPSSLNSPSGQGDMMLIRSTIAVRPSDSVGKLSCFRSLLFDFFTFAFASIDSLVNVFAFSDSFGSADVCSRDSSVLFGFGFLGGSFASDVSFSSFSFSFGFLGFVAGSAASFSGSFVFLDGFFTSAVSSDGFSAGSFPSACSFFAAGFVFAFTLAAVGGATSTGGSASPMGLASFTLLLFAATNLFSSAPTSPSAGASLFGASAN